MRHRQNIWGDEILTILNITADTINLQKSDGFIFQFKIEQFEQFLQNGQITPFAPDNEEHERLQSVLEIMKGASPEEQRQANFYAEIIRCLEKGQDIPSDIVLPPARTLRYLRRKYRLAQTRFGYGYVGLLPQHHKKGNRNPKLPPETIALIHNIIENRFAELRRRKCKAVWRVLKNDCITHDPPTPAPSYQAFLDRVKSYSAYLLQLAREGKRAAYWQKPIYMYLTPTTPIHGSYEWEIAHVDHTQINLETLSTITGENLGKPWLSILILAKTRRIVAVILSYDKPSYRTLMLLLRECVRRNKRLPSVLVFDNGKEFLSVYFETLTAMYEIEKIRRPPAEPRHGSVCENIFNLTEEQFIPELLGNSLIMKKARLVTKSHNPKEYAVWTFGRAKLIIEYWAYEVYDQLYHGTLGCSPRQASTLDKRFQGERVNGITKFDDFFFYLTLPTTEKTTAKVQPGREFQLLYVVYTAVELEPVIGQNVDVRYDPFNRGIAFAYVKGNWIPCFSKFYTIFWNRSEREIEIASQLIRKRQLERGEHENINDQLLVEFYKTIEQHEVELLALQHLYDRELRESYRDLLDLPSDPQSISLPPQLDIKALNPSVVAETSLVPLMSTTTIVHKDATDICEEF